VVGVGQELLVDRVEVPVMVATRRVQEILHQHHHHKEILVASGLLLQQHQIMGQEEEVDLPKQDLQELLLPVEQVEMEQHLLFLEHQ
jgi:hypothetical protein